MNLKHVMVYALAGAMLAAAGCSAGAAETSSDSELPLCLTRTGIRAKITPARTIRQAGVRYARKQMMSFYGLWPMPPSSVRVSPDIYLKSGMASWTQTRPISVSALP